jgi:kynurenine formamidase
MCDSDQNKPGTGWRGWMELPAPRLCVPAGDWIDLSWPLSPEVPRIASFPPPRLTRIASIPERPLNITELQMVVHTGTHVDSPRHFYDDGPAFQDIPLARLTGAGVAWRMDLPLYGLIEPADLEAMRPRLAPGDILAIDTGAAARVGTPDYDRHASLSVAAAQWLVEQRVKLLALDTPTPDLALDKRPEGFIWPVHRVLLAAGVLIAEQVTNLGALAGRRAEFLFCPLNIADGDGAPARVLARAIAH